MKSFGLLFAAIFAPICQSLWMTFMMDEAPNSSISEFPAFFSDRHWFVGALIGAVIGYAAGRLIDNRKPADVNNK